MVVGHVEVPKLAIALALSDLLWVFLVCGSALGGTNTASAGDVASLAAGQAAAVPAILIMASSIFGSLLSTGLYQRAFLSGRKLLERTGLGIVQSLSLSAFAFWLLTVEKPSAAGLIGIHLAAFAGVVFTRRVICRLADFPVFKRRVLVLGSPLAASRVGEIERANRPSRFVCVGLVPAAGKSRIRLLDAARNGAAEQIVVTDNELFRTQAQELLACRAKGIQISSLASFFERETRRIDPCDRESIRLVLTEGAHRGRAGRAIKRGFDILGSLSLLLATLPLTTLVALAIWLEDGGPILFRQERVGLKERPFMILKFRSMVIDAEPDNVAKWAAPSDPRVTTVGRFLRRSRIDEIPQLINVLLGDMSIVGPRPERPSIVAQLKECIPLYSSRHLILPGLTGWAQINYPYGDSVEDALHKTMFDLYYVKNGSLILDLIILLQTIRVVILGEGSR